QREGAVGVRGQPVVGEHAVGGRGALVVEDGDPYPGGGEHLGQAVHLGRRPSGGLLGGGVQQVLEGVVGRGLRVGPEMVGTDEDDVGGRLSTHGQLTGARTSTRENRSLGSSGWATRSTSSCRALPAVASRAQRSAAKSEIAKPTESNSVICSAPVRPAAAPVSTSHSSVPGKPSGICWISPLLRVCGVNWTNPPARSRIRASSSVLPGQSPPIAFRCTPGRTCETSRIVFWALSAVQVVMMSAPATASSTVVAAWTRKS